MSELVVDYGDPQGTFLGPMLFIINLNDVSINTNQYKAMIISSNTETILLRWIYVSRVAKNA